LNVLRQLLHHRFGAPLDYFDAVFADFDLAALAQLSEIAFTVDNLTAFETELAALKAAPQQADRGAEQG
jgi:hypothetical protein